MSKIIFVGGIHGVGKTWQCQRLAGMMAIDHYSDSRLIMDLKGEQSYDADKSVKNIDSNQDILLSAIKKYIDQDVVAIIDGHFCLFNAEHEIKKIPMKTFMGIAPIAIIVLYDTIGNISNKIYSRDNVIYDYDFLSSFQDKEIKYSKYIAEYLRVPYLMFNVSEDIGVIKGFIDKLRLDKDER